MTVVGLPYDEVIADLGAERRGALGGRALRLLLVGLDLGAVVLAWTAAFLVGGTPLDRHALALLGVAAGAAYALLLVARLYQARVSSVRSIELARLTWITLLIGGAVVLADSRADQSTMGPAGIAVGVLLAFGLLVTGRGAYDAWLRDGRSRGRYCRRVLLVGTAGDADQLEALLGENPELGYRVSGVLGPRPSDRLASGTPWLGEIDRVLEAIKEVDANGVIVASDALPAAQRSALIRQLLDAGVHVQISSGLQGIHYRRLRLAPIAHEPLFYVERSTPGRLQATIKRTIDLIIAALMVLLALPVLAVCALMIKLSDRGPVLFRQRRVGRNGVEFDCLKLRTMIVGAEARQHEVENTRGDGPLFKAAGDPRVTRVGRFLRASSLDELPQLLNVIKGDMSMVGPRPALPQEIARFDEELRLRLEVPPGLTGLWQVEARDNPSFNAYRRLDLFYVENWSIGLDLVIMVLTAQAVVARLVRHALRRKRATGRAGANSTTAAAITLD